MPIYCYKCDCCDNKFEVLGSYVEVGILEWCECPECSCMAFRDYSSELPSIRSDWKPGFNKSIGLPYSGRRDLINKMRRSGHYPIGLGNSATMPDKNYYGDEEYHEASNPYKDERLVGEEIGGSK